jgi:hypothetical protein
LTPLPAVLDEAERLLRASTERGVVLRLLGGVAVALRCPSVRTNELLRRNYADMDLVGHKRQSKAINDLFVQLGYEPRRRFNAMMGMRRLVFNDMTNERRVDLFLDIFEMCHRFDLSARMELEPLTIPLADLVATKLQIVQISEKDLKDLTAIFLDHGLGDADGEVINGPYLARICANDWGTYKTFSVNLSKLAEFTRTMGLSKAELDKAATRSASLAELIEKEPKSLAWRMRARVGERKQWYELPEADSPLVVSD